MNKEEVIEWLSEYNIKHIEDDLYHLHTPNGIVGIFIIGDNSWYYNFNKNIGYLYCFIPKKGKNYIHCSKHAIEFPKNKESHKNKVLNILYKLPKVSHSYKECYCDSQLKKNKSNNKYKNYVTSIRSR